MIDWIVVGTSRAPLPTLQQSTTIARRCIHLVDFIAILSVKIVRLCEKINLTEPTARYSIGSFNSARITVYTQKMLQFMHNVLS